MTSKIRFLAVLALTAAAATSAFAQQGPRAERAPHGPAAGQTERPDFAPVTRGQALGRAAERFDAADVDKDGVLSRDEMRAARQARRETHAERKEVRQDRREDRAERREGATRTPRHAPTQH